MNTVAFTPASNSSTIEMIFSSENRDYFIRVLQRKALLRSGPQSQGVTVVLGTDCRLILDLRRDNSVKDTEQCGLRSKIP